MFHKKMYLISPLVVILKIKFFFASYKPNLGVGTPFLVPTLSNIDPLTIYMFKLHTWDHVWRPSWHVVIIACSIVYPLHCLMGTYEVVIYIVAKLIESHSIYLTIFLCLWHRQSCLNLSLSTCTSKDLDLEKNLDSSPKSGPGKEHTFLSTQTRPLGGWMGGWVGGGKLWASHMCFSLVTSVGLVPLAQVWTDYVTVSSVKRTLMIELNCEKNIKNFK
jgi:hypothetical protein